ARDPSLFHRFVLSLWAGTPAVDDPVQKGQDPVFPKERLTGAMAVTTRNARCRQHIMTLIPQHLPDCVRSMSQVLKVMRGMKRFPNRHQVIHRSFTAGSGSGST